MALAAGDAINQPPQGAPEITAEQGAAGVALAANLLAWPLAYFAAQAYLSVFIQRITLTPLPFVLSLGFFDLYTVSLPFISQTCRAVDSLMTTEGDCGPSASVRSRPRMMGIRIVRR